MQVQAETANSSYRIGGLMGEHCVDHIEQTLSQLEGVRYVNVDQINKHVAVEYDPQLTNRSSISETLTTLGYSIRGG